LYSASIAPYTKHLSGWWKAGLSYLLTDEAYAVTIGNYEREGDNSYKHWFFLGAGLTLWIFWQLSTAAGILLGAVIPAEWSLDFAAATHRNDPAALEDRATVSAGPLPAWWRLASRCLSGLVAADCWNHGPALVEGRRK
jgi:hypothetical protein